MKVLWFSHISLSQNKAGIFFYPGGNWISSLCEIIEIENNIKLGIVFFGDSDSITQNNLGTTYYQLRKKYSTKLKNYYKNWKHEIESEYQLEKLLFTIQDFKPDIIHIFGTESMFGYITKHTDVPVVIHLQGLINPCINAWYFPGFKMTSLLKSLNLIYFIKGVGFFHDYFRLKKMAKRELDILRMNNHFMGRTHWDKAVTKLYVPNSNYYHCAEVIRSNFYTTKWNVPQGEKLIISSIMNANIYKGLDLILKTAKLIKQNTTIIFEWNIYGIKSGSEYARFTEDIVADNFNNNNIILKGTVLGDDLIVGLLNSNLFVHSSYIDNSPNSVCEAQLIGLPVISTNVGGISSLIKDEVNGFLVPPNEPHILASKIIDLANNPSKLLEISRNSYIVAHERHDRAKIVGDLINIYYTIMNTTKIN